MVRWLVAAAAATLACDPPATAPRPAHPEPRAEAPYLDPAGLWPPERAAARLEELRGGGIALSADSLDRVLRATVKIGDCSGAFVSPEGLVVTARRCVASGYGAAGASLRDGFSAQSREDELASDDGLRLQVLLRRDDVTSAVRGALVPADEPLARWERMDARVTRLVGECEAPHIRCEIVSQRAGSRYVRLRYLEIPDVRLVYAPPAGVAASEPGRRWRWPRPVGDIALVRAYVGPQGAPTRARPDSAPFRPLRHVTIARGGVAEGDPVTIAGHPRRTHRDATARALRHAAEWKLPRLVRRSRDLVRAARELHADQPDRRAVVRRLREVELRLRRARGVLAGLGGALERRRARQDELARWLDEHPERARAHDGALAAIEAAQSAMWETRERDASVAELDVSVFYRAARIIAGMAAERPLPDQRRAPRYRARNAGRLEAELARLAAVDDPVVDRRLLEVAVRRAMRKLNINRAWLRDVLRMDTFDPDAVDGELARLYGMTRMDEPERRLALFRDAALEKVETSGDPFLHMALALRSRRERIAVGRRTFAGELAVLGPRYAAALAAFRDAPRAPDAAGGLRVSFGRVRGYRPDPDEPARPPLAETVGGESTAAFISTADAAGGFAGAPTVGDGGELVGVAVERVYEGLASDWVLDPSTSRTIHVDIRHLFALLERDGAGAILDELGGG